MVSDMKHLKIVKKNVVLQSSHTLDKIPIETSDAVVVHAPNLYNMPDRKKYNEIENKYGCIILWNQHVTVIVPCFTSLKI
jgi:hypothetical protein